MCIYLCMNISLYNDSHCALANVCTGWIKLSAGRLFSEAVRSPPERASRDCLTKIHVLKKEPMIAKAYLNGHISLLVSRKCLAR